MNLIGRWLLSAVLCLIMLAPVDTRGQTSPFPEEPFPLLPGLEKPVEFWKRVFSEFSLSQIVFFDALDMSNIYEVLEVGVDNRTSEYISEQKARIAAAHGVDIERVKAQRGVKERTAAGLKRSGRYIAQMRQIFQERGLPIELTYLPVVESSYDLNARSSAGALGLWQFMRGTAKDFRLRIDRAMDERKDPLESTRAAAALLSQNYQALGSWPLALTAYNYGQAGISRAVAALESDNLVELIEKYQHPNWGFAAKNFYAEFLAAVEIAKNVNHYFPGLEFDPSSEIKEIEFKNGASVAAILAATGLSEAQFYAWNPAFFSSIKSIPAGYRVKVPADFSSEPLIARVQQRPQEEPLLRHRVKRGETLQQIARRYGASVEKILKLNGIRKPSLVGTGTMLLIPRA